MKNMKLIKEFDEFENDDAEKDYIFDTYYEDVVSSLEEAIESAKILSKYSGMNYDEDEKISELLAKLKEALQFDSGKFPR